jgi:hypothetical protein
VPDRDLFIDIYIPYEDSARGNPAIWRHCDDPISQVDELSLSVSRVVDRVKNQSQKIDGKRDKGKSS